jgi:Na+-driven multidrug efflux pump
VHQENTALLAVLPHPKKINPLLQTISFGINSVAVAIYIVANSKFVSALNSAAGGVVGPYQSVIFAAGLGFTLSTGLELSVPMANKNYKTAGDVEKAGVITSIGVGAVTSATMLSMKKILPLIFESQTAEVASDFFLGASIGTIPLIILITDTQLAFQEGHWFIPPLSGAALLTGSIPSSYLFGFFMDQGAFGVGVGSALAPTAVCLAMRLWFLTASYKKYNLYGRPDLSTFPIKIKKSFVEGAKLSVQRLTEWANLAIIVDVISKGHNGSAAVTAINPLFEYFRVFGAIFQGIGQGTGMLVKKNIEQMQLALRANKNSDAIQFYNNIMRIIRHSVLVGVLVSSVVNVSFYFFQAPLTGFFLDNSSSQTHELAKTLFWIGLLGLIPDSVRLIMVGALRGWKDLVYPMLVSVVTMIFIGIPAGWGFSKIVKQADETTETSEAAFQLYLRNLTVLVAAIILTVRCVKLALKDAGQLNINQPVQNEAEDRLCGQRQSDVQRETGPRPLNGQVLFFSTPTPVSGSREQGAGSPRPV